MEPLSADLIPYTEAYRRLNQGLAPSDEEARSDEMVWFIRMAWEWRNQETTYAIAVVYFSAATAQDVNVTFFEATTGGAAEFEGYPYP